MFKYTVNIDTQTRESFDIPLSLIPGVKLWKIPINLSRCILDMAMATSTIHIHLGFHSLYTLLRASLDPHKYVHSRVLTHQMHAKREAADNKQ